MEKQEQLVNLIICLQLWKTISWPEEQGEITA